MPNALEGVRLRHLRNQRAAAIALGGVAFLVAFVYAFVPALQTRFVSDTFGLYVRAQQQSPMDLVGLLAPQAAHWYRPLTDSVFWLEVRAFGTNAVAYHLVALAALVLAAGLTLGLTERLSGSRLAATCAALVFLFNPHAQEPLWDVADLHTVLAVPLLLATVLAYVSGRRTISLLLALLTLGADETGILAIGVVFLYELIAVAPATGRAGMKSGLRRLWPFAALGIGYLLLRFVGGSIYVENTPCHSPSCFLAAGEEYFARTFVRPDKLLYLWGHRWIYVVLCLGAVALGVVVTRAWAWSRRGMTAFVVAWWALATVYFVYTLWPYVADRFIYVPDAAVAVLVGLALVRTVESRRSWSRLRMWANVLVGVALVAWIAGGVWMLHARGQLWLGAGQQAQTIVDGVQRLLPDPPPNAVIVVLGVPDETVPAIPPSNTGPYVFHNGLDSAIHLAYDRYDLTVIVVRDADATSAPPGAYVFDYRDGSIVRVA